MKKFRLLVGVAGCIALMASGATAQEVLSQNVVGYYNVPINQGLNLVAFPFQKIPAARGVVSANTGTTITDAAAAWAVGFFNVGVTGSEATGTSTFYIEITSGAFEGRHFYIASNTENALTVTGGLPTDVEAGDLVGASYKVIAANRVRDLFGEPGEPLLMGNSSAATADNILVWTGAGWGGAIYYKTSGAPIANQQHWNRGTTLVNDEVIDRDAALFVRRRDASSVAVTIVGEVSQNAQQIVLSSGLNLIGGLSVVDEHIGTTTLTNTLAGGASAATADNILAWTGSAWDGAVFFKTSGAPIANQMHWNRGTTIVDLNDANAFSFNPTKGYFFRVRAAQALGPWLRPSPLAE